MPKIFKSLSSTPPRDMAEPEASPVWEEICDLHEGQKHDGQDTRQSGAAGRVAAQLPVVLDAYATAAALGAAAGDGVEGDVYIISGRPHIRIGVGSQECGSEDTDMYPKAPPDRRRSKAIKMPQLELFCRDGDGKAISFFLGIIDSCCCYDIASEAFAKRTKHWPVQEVEPDCRIAGLAKEDVVPLGKISVRFGLAAGGGSWCRELLVVSNGVAGYDFEVILGAETKLDIKSDTGRSIKQLARLKPGELHR